MRISIANVNGAVPDADLQAAVAAISSQVTRDFSPEWGVTAQLQAHSLSIGQGKVPVQGIGDAVIYVGAAAQSPVGGAGSLYGYHCENFSNVAYGFVFMDVCGVHGYSWTATLSHEVLETLADPTAALSVAGPDPNNPQSNVQYVLEVCDPVMGDLYKVDGVDVANFVNRFYFGLLGPAKRASFMDLPLEPFKLRPGGYYQFVDSTGAKQQIRGAKVNQENMNKAAHLMGEWRRNARR
jgi:hypothetical protein